VEGFVSARRFVQQFALVACFVACGASTAAAEDTFAVPRGLAGQVEFWKLIFTTYDATQIVVHDSEEPERIYSILDFRALARGGLSEAALRAEMNEAEARETRRIRALLERLHDAGTGREGLSVEELRIRGLFRDDARPDKFLRAADEKRVRAQRGIRGRFLTGLQRSRRYLPRMEKIFRAEGVPLEVARLPLIESSFNTNAYSKVGAAGMWQFMPSTGRLFLTISPTVDERLDPFVSTRAAARFLRQNYERLRSWPLAITAYNHGPGGMARAVEEVGSRDIVEIIDRYDGKGFGFASRNFYAEFLAALDVERRPEDFFGRVPLDPPLRTDDVVLGEHVAVASVLRCSESDLETFKALNPALRPAAFQRGRWLPAGYQVRLPPGAGRSFDSCYARLPSTARRSSPPASAPVVARRSHRVRRGETLASIARRYGVSVDRLRKENDISNRHLIRVGEVLKIPGSGAPRVAEKPRAAKKKVVHKVRRGQTLNGIARSYGESVESLRRHNRIGDHNQIRVGQLLEIPSR
jgi:membrane-bound lytic murein transglycosylase D